MLVRLLTISFFAFQNYLLLDSMKKDKEHLSTFPISVVNNKSDESRLVIIVSFLVHYSVIIFMGVVEFSWRMPNLDIVVNISDCRGRVIRELRLSPFSLNRIAC